MIIKGNIISAEKFGEIKIFENSYILIKNDKIISIEKEIPLEFKNEEVIDYGNKLIFQSFSDMHLHAPQYPMLGMGFDLELLDWLKTYTFPTEAKFKNNNYARKVYKKLALELVKNGTTKVAMFSSLHKEATLILMEELENAGVTGYVGKVNMDRNGGIDLEEDTDESISETIDWLNRCHFDNVKPIITPRFIPSCTPKLSKKLGEIANEYDLPIQSHLSENLNEIKWVKELEGLDYYKAYQKYNLWTNRTLMAHCVHSNAEEMKAMKEAGVYVVHCPASNNNLSSGFAKVRDLLDNNVNVVLGSDIAGGNSLSMFDSVVDAIKISKDVDIVRNKKSFLTVEEAFYLATSASAKFFNEEAGFAKGNKFSAVVLDDSNLLDTDKLSIKQRFERMFYNRQDNAIKAVYSNSKLVYK